MLWDSDALISSCKSSKPVTGSDEQKNWAQLQYKLQQQQQQAQTFYGQQLQAQTMTMYKQQHENKCYMNDMRLKDVIGVLGKCCSLLEPNRLAALIGGDPGL